MRFEGTFGVITVDVKQCEDCNELFELIKTFWDNDRVETLKYLSVVNKKLLKKRIVAFLNTDRCEWDIFMFACLSQQYNIIEFLLKTGKYNINEFYKSSNPKTPLHLVYKNIELLNLFISTGKADPQLTGVFIEACMNGDASAAILMYNMCNCTPNHLFYSHPETYGHEYLCNHFKHNPKGGVKPGVYIEEYVKH